MLLLEYFSKRSFFFSLATYLIYFPNCPRYFLIKDYFLNSYFNFISEYLKQKIPLKPLAPLVYPEARLISVLTLPTLSIWLATLAPDFLRFRIYELNTYQSLKIIDSLYFLCTLCYIPASFSSTIIFLNNPSNVFE